MKSVSEKGNMREGVREDGCSQKDSQRLPVTLQWPERLTTAAPDMPLQVLCTAPANDMSGKV